MTKMFFVLLFIGPSLAVIAGQALADLPDAPLQASNRRLSRRHGLPPREGSSQGSTVASEERDTADTTDRRTCRQSISSTQTDAPKKSGWNSVEVNPLVFISAVYKGTFRVSIYKRQNDTDKSMTQYFYAPALILDPTSARCTYSKFNERYEMTFSVIMWDDDYEEFVRSVLSKKLGVTDVPATLIRILPIEEIRIATAGRNDAYEVYDKWISYASQPSIFNFRFLTVRTDKCAEIAKRMQEDPEDFVNNLVVYYSLLTQRSARSTLEIRAEHIKGGKMATSLQQKLPDKETIYMTTDDAKSMTMEMATNVVAVQVKDQDFVSTDQSLQISTLIESILKMTPQSTADFDAQSWNSVFWNDENARPDKITNEMNEVYSKLDTESKDRVKTAMSSDTSQSGGVGVGFKGVEVSANLALANDHASESEREKYAKTMSEAKKHSEWNGERFVPKPMSLSRVNTAAFKSTTAIATTQVSVAKTTSELTSRINILDSANSVASVKKQRDELLVLKEDAKKQRDDFVILQEELKRSQKVTLDLTKTVAGVSSNADRIDTRVSKLYKWQFPCSGTSIRDSGASVTTSMSNAPIGRVCIGNSQSPSPNENFVVFDKISNSNYTFSGTQSVEGGFISFTPYVKWVVDPANLGNSKGELGGCNLVPQRLRGNLNGVEVFCSKYNPSGSVWLVNHYYHDAVVDDDGSITVMSTYSETLWY